MLFSSMRQQAEQHVVADLGNSRLKWGLVDPAGRVAASVALAVDDPGAWANAWETWGLGIGVRSSWTIATVNPPLAERLSAFLRERGVLEVRWFRSASDVPIKHELEHAETAGADRALAVAEAIATHPNGQPGLVVSCGSAITVERISAGGVWEGGAIAPGLGLSARALHELTAQLPLVTPSDGPPPFGHSTRPALEAGLFWGAVGTVRELLTRQADGLSPKPWLVWTGGDARRLAPWITWPEARVESDLVLHGLARTL